MKIEEIEREIMFADMVLNVIKNVKTPMLLYEEEKDVVRKALTEYKSKLENETQVRKQAGLDFDGDWADFCNNKEDKILDKLITVKEKMIGESEEKSVQDERVKLVIDIDKNTYEDIKRGKIYSSYYDVPLESVLAIANGTVLSKKCN